MIEGTHTTFMDLCNRIFTMKESFYSTLSDLAVSKAQIHTSYTTIGKDQKEFDEYWIYTFKGIIRNYLNIFEYACLLYNEGIVDIDLFQKLFKNEIINIWENDSVLIAEINFKNPNTEDGYEQLYTTYKKFKEIKGE